MTATAGTYPDPHTQAHEYRGFSVPHEPFDIALLEDLTVSHYRRVLYSFLSRFGHTVDKHCDGVIPLLHEWLEGPTDFDVVWDPSFGKVRELLCPPGNPDEEGSLPSPSCDAAEVIERVAALMLRLGECGMAGSFRITLPAAASLRWGQLRLPLADSLCVDTDGERAVIVASLGTQQSRVALNRGQREWGATGAASSLPGIEWGSRTVLINAEEDPEIIRCGGHLPMAADARPAAIAQVKAAISVIEEHAPVYVPWVQRVLRQLVPSTPVRAADMVSGSFVHRPGVIMLSAPMSVLVAAELLAHEACHQHFWLLVQAGAVDDGTDPDKRHFSPYVSAKRNLRMMLMTYHAFGNAVLFHRMCRAGGLVRPEGYAREEQFTELFEPYEQVLGQSTALTPLGRVLWETVAERLHGCSAGALGRASSAAEFSSTEREGV